MYSTYYILCSWNTYIRTYVWTFNRSAFAYGLFVEDTFQSPPPSSILHGNNPTSKNSSARGKKAVFLQLQPQNCINFITLKWLNDCAIRGLGYPIPIKTLYYYYYCGSILFGVYSHPSASTVSHSTNLHSTNLWACIKKFP